MTSFFNNTFPPNIVTFVSQRPDDFSYADNQNDLTEDQKQFVSTALEIQQPEVINIRQVHGDKIIKADKDYFHRRQSLDLEEADGSMTKTSCLPLAIRTADCLPVFMYDTKQGGIALIHAGWQGVKNNILTQAVRRMTEEWQTDPKDIQAAFGPAIHSCCCEVGEEFEDYFPQDLIVKDGKRYLDLPQAGRRQLVHSGLREKNITDSGICTCCDQKYFSCRRDGANTGRMISLMMLKGETSLRAPKGRSNLTRSVILRNEVTKDLFRSFTRYARSG